MPSYDSIFIKEKTPAVLLSRLESRLRHPFMLEMEYEMQALNELQFALQQETTMVQYKTEVMTMRNMLMVNIGWLGIKDYHGLKFLFLIFRPIRSSKEFVNLAAGKFSKSYSRGNRVVQEKSHF